jgi:hypothetical protein
LIPTHYNDGRVVEPEKMMLILGLFDKRFGGCRFIEPSEGHWGGQIEGMHEVEVAVVAKRVPELREIVLAIGRDLGQKQMYFDAPKDATVELIDVETGLDADELEQDSTAAKKKAKKRKGG